MAAKAPAAGSSSLDRLPLAGKIGVGLLFLTLVGALFFVFVYEDLSNDLAAAKQREGTLRGELRAAEAVRDAYQKDRDEKIRSEARAEQTKKILPDEPETPAFLASLQQTATIAGVNLTSWTPVDEVPQEFFAKVPMKLTLTGRYHQIAKFFHGVGQIDRIINMEDIQMKLSTKNGTVRPDQPVEPEVTVECLGTAFRALRLDGKDGAKRRGTGK
ncbi:type 4a pilus biogenesis protein PilO [Polyangium mundeleinium]|uniref:Type 4a pilus biogenesis protein PilO n=1 Tax=Polyangium mundeleinium TaxID=2995306 RepID=A0ABT5F189_9BACT|nr:type 4a pilus biogenesis protein PilO [Polyangium mundeleinium]MDC0747766.1 type 4a pilus biogenesis protein PilO [Polyangium mundeleinium]